METNVKSNMWESQVVEWKQKWSDQCFISICAFANSKGGTLEIGRDDEGKVVGLENIKGLLEKIPEQIKSILKIIAEVNLLYDNELPYISIEVFPSLFAVDYGGKYYRRSGSTNQQLTGNTLYEFLIKNPIVTWDERLVNNIGCGDLDMAAFSYFKRELLANKRFSENDINVTNEELLAKMNLVDGDSLRQAAILAFHNDPEKWCTGAYVKIGFYNDNNEMLFDDEIHGPLISMPDRVINMINNIISYKRIEQEFAIQIDALKEAVLNAIVHKDYSSKIPIHIHIYNDKITISNSAVLPENYSTKDLLYNGPKPHNPLIANVFAKCGMMKEWGNGINNMINSSIKDGNTPPEFEVSGTDFKVVFKNAKIELITFSRQLDTTLNANIKLHRLQK